MPHPFRFAADPRVRTHVETFPHGQPAPKSPGLPPSGPARDTHKVRDKEHRLHPAKKGRPSRVEKELIVQTALQMMGTARPELIARKVGRDTTTIKALIKSAREDMQARASDYVEAHWNATKVAADLGDAKPAQWAIEHIGEGEQRIVEREKAGATSPSISIGIALGGVPQPTAPIDVTPIAVRELPEATEGFTLPEDLTP